MLTFRRPTYLRDTVRAVLAQSFRDFELIVADDASPDETPEVMAEFVKADPRVRYQRNRSNLGIPGNLNSAVQSATGDFIIVLHDHDEYHPRLFERMLGVFDRNPSVGFVHPGLAWMRSDGNAARSMLADFPEITSGRDLANRMLLGSTFACPIPACAMVSRAAYDTVGITYDPRFGFLSDVDMWLRLCLHYDVGYVREPLVVARERESDHEFAQTDWRLIRWSVAIHEANIERHYGQDPRRLRQARLMLSRRRVTVFRHSLLSCLVQGNLKAFREGLQLLSTDGQLVDRVVASVLRNIEPAHPMLLALGARVNSVRRRRSTS